MIDKNIFRDVFTCKKTIGIVLVSDLIQALMIVLTSYIIAFLANAMLFSQLDKTAMPLMALLFFFFLIKAALGYYNRLQVEKISLQLQTKLRYKLLSVLSRKQTNGNQLSEGQWIAIITKGVNKLDVYVTNFIPQMGILMITPLVLLLMAFYMDWISALIFLFTAPLIPGFMILIGKLANKENKQQWEVFQKLSAFMVDFLPGLIVIKAYNQTKVQLKALEENGKVFSETTLRVLRVAFLSAFMLELISTLSIALIALNIGLRLIYGEAVFFPVFFILLIAPQFYQPLRQFGSAFHDGMNGITAAKEIYDLLALDSEGPREEATNKVADSKGWSIELKGVNYTYGEELEGNWVLKDLSLRIPAGEQVVITGPNGAGKSTVFKLLLKILQPASGEISLNNQALATVSRGVLRDNIGYVAQQPYIFSTTIRENITMGRAFNEDDIAKVLTLVNLEEFISELPQGLDTVVGSIKKLSSGQVRRLGLARALIGSPKLVLLDEPMENLDPLNEELIGKVLASLKGKTTVVIIGHRLQTLKGADEVVILQGGQVVEAGNPARLQANPQGYFTSLLKEATGEVEA